MSSLTDRQERFIAEYLIDQNASAAAARAGYTARNMSAQGNELLNHPEISERIRGAMEAVLAELRAEALAMMKRRLGAAFFEAERLVRNGWEPVPVEELDEETRALVEVRRVMRKCGLVTTVKQPDRHKALRALERFHEKLEMLQEKEAQRLWKAGLGLSLEEIEALDGASEFPEKDQEMLGGGVGVGEGIVEKGGVLLGRGVEPGEGPRLRETEIRGRSTKSPIGPGDIVVRPQFPAPVGLGAFEKHEIARVLLGGEEMAGCALAVG